MHRLRVGIVGAGLMGRWHAQAAEKAGADVIATYDSDVERARALAARHRGSRECPTLGDLLELVDVVHVCTPTDSHASIASDALRAARHVLVEKPLTTTADDAAAMLDLAASVDRLICPVHQFLFQDGARRILNNLDAIGDVRHLDITICSAGAEGRDAVARDNVAREILPHPLSVLARIDGAVDRLPWIVRHPAPGEIRALAGMASSTAAITISMSGRPTSNRMILIGARGTAHVDFFHGFGLVQAGTVSYVRKIAQPFAYAGASALAAASNLARRSCRRERAYPGLRALLSEFYAAVRGRQKSPISHHEMIGVTRAYEQLCGALNEQLPLDQQRRHPGELMRGELR
jgi:predicted dehydrogenase